MAAFNVILERVEAQLRVVAEGVTLTRDTLRQEMRELRTELSGRMDTLEFAVRKNSADIRQNSADIQKNSADIQKNSADIQKNSADIERLAGTVRELETKLDAKADADRVARLEQRVDALEA